MAAVRSTPTPSGCTKQVAVIGAGISGITSAGHLLRHGLKVVLFERSSIAGGVWHYDPRSALEPPYPNEKPPTPDGYGSGVNGTKYQSLEANDNFETTSLAHAPPSPCYKGLRNNVPTSLMRSTLMSWSPGTEEFVSQDLIEKYIQDLALHTGVQEHILYDMSVESVAKSTNSSAPKWTIRTRTLRKTGSAPEFLARQWDDFDAVVVASGHYHEPRIPDLPGLSAWKQKFPDNVMHSKQYRKPDVFKDKTVLIIGAGVSSLDIARELGSVAKKTYQSVRGGSFDLPATLLPENAERVGKIEKFVLNESADTTSSPRPGEVVLKDGRVLTDIDVIILGTGYLTSYPFLGPTLQSPYTEAESADDKVIITSDGCVTHNLHHDIFYIPDPSLLFVGVPYHVSTFSFFDFQAEVVARVLSGKARLPSQEVMRSTYEKRKMDVVGGSKNFHSLLLRETEYIDEILAWVNGEARKLGVEEMEGVDGDWRARVLDPVGKEGVPGVVDRVQGAVGLTTA
ncbi:uncharacterized protein BCR38DRAFT_463832 [Pseudomassariella vexata]|uniref:FAD dependent oxidoreductase domain-containing protein n=1 Tax=Pseudomassariella vexata TaxID=1141098 RepID=A0A1Y2E9M6_9PEZI|nr:uncharacterized protein BCR38DRAFT_463832 [Pseudomassariella vexata]ORY68280.1 hypothetical protein BCR38DRAFT_463832 [Pseudomassariella vexata]